MIDELQSLSPVNDDAGATTQQTRPSPLSFALWALVGACLGLGAFGIMTIGVVFIVLGVALAAICLNMPRFRNMSAVAAISGLGLPCLYIAWLNRGGPGEVCEQTNSSLHCYEAWNPWPFLAVGLVLIAAGAAAAWLTAKKPQAIG